jgi:hypothetical protein
VGKLVDLPPGSLVLQFFGGTSLLIMVGVVLDVMRQVETQLLQSITTDSFEKGNSRVVTTASTRAARRLPARPSFIFGR